jgi:hypothetical protein
VLGSIGGWAAAHRDFLRRMYGLGRVHDNRSPPVDNSSTSTAHYPGPSHPQRVPATTVKECRCNWFTNLPAKVSASFFDYLSPARSWSRQVLPIAPYTPAAIGAGRKRGITKKECERPIAAQTRAAGSAGDGHAASRPMNMEGGNNEPR